ncbi:MAG TPA: VTT domain-containing protein [Chthoniobacterales bacterium]|nr:VTT domain-containing protein [Chthoniobacterales bacterium]
MLQARPALYFQVTAVTIAIAALLLLSHFFPVIDFVVALQRRVVELGAWGGICYPLLFAGCNVLLLPGGVLCVGAGFFFGLWWGFFIVLLGNSIAAAIAFGVSRRWLGNRWSQRRAVASPILGVLERAVERDAWKIIFLSQLHPLFPTSLLNYLFGVTRIRFAVYMFWTTVGRAPGLFLYTYLGTLGQFSLNLALGRTHPRVVEYWTWGGAFLVTAVLFILLTRMALNALRETQEGLPDSQVKEIFPKKMIVNK